jgi:glycosyltransferase involved in cell wall biosynthesis
MCKVSVVIPYFNREDTILRALDSVVSQTYTNYEVILVNDGSTDSGQELVEEFILRYPNFKNINQKNQGPSAARNTGIKAAKGDYIAFLDSDDSWEVNKLKIQMQYIEAYSADLIACNSNIVLPDRVLKKYYTRKEIQKINFTSALFKYYTSTPCVVVKKKVLREIGGFPEDMYLGEDIYVFNKIIRQYKCYVIKHFLTNNYKELYGRGGLTGDLKAGQRSNIYNLKIAREENYLYNKKVHLATYFFAYLFSVLKYWRRVLIVKFNSRKSRGVQ